MALTLLWYNAVAFIFAVYTQNIFFPLGCMVIFHWLFFEPIFGIGTLSTTEWNQYYPISVILWAICGLQMNYAFRIGNLFYNTYCDFIENIATINKDLVETFPNSYFPVWRLVWRVLFKKDEEVEACVSKYIHSYAKDIAILNITMIFIGLIPLPFELIPEWVGGVVTIAFMMLYSVIFYFALTLIRNKKLFCGIEIEFVSIISFTLVIYMLLFWINWEWINFSQFYFSLICAGVFIVIFTLIHIFFMKQKFVKRESTFYTFDQLDEMQTENRNITYVETEKKQVVYTNTKTPEVPPPQQSTVVLVTQPQPSSQPIPQQYQTYPFNTANTSYYPQQATAPGYQKSATVHSFN